jgi:hypothetical protein
MQYPIQSEDTFFFKNNKEGHRLLIKSNTGEGDPVRMVQYDRGYWALLKGKAVNPVTLTKQMEFMLQELP